ncbi:MULTISPECIES: DUF6119 family protein [Actinoalloteichus]|uniref:Sporadically distributed protein, TIGR04141 family n=1 Tax=Actinoalloteichus fjordicus TaxID=1612552 RepID=A0AAC9PRM1_9PSEU|nr:MULTISPECIES: DUF6119 family protein [Actinoalloteichus]APU14107.1 sporadically distributed protein, TIGR04141 family [Actinoalloteichus fjordicus]APU20055.1 sporadically distributed protein, TIGR04141 family [Actinoalloteichus sp. GBA129-24]
MTASNVSPVIADEPKKAPPDTRKTSLYRLRTHGPVADEPLRSFVLPRYLDRDGFAAVPVNHEGVRGLLVSGTVAPGRADWCHPLSALAGRLVSEENRTAFGLLLVRTDSAVYGLTYGMGHLMIDPARIDPGFGIAFAVRCLNEDRITKVRRQLMDARGRTDENSATRGEHIREYGIEQYGEIVSQISGQISGVGLTFTRDRKRAAHVTGNDRSIKLHIGSSPAALLHDLHQIEEVCARPSPLPEFEFIAQVRPLGPKSEQAQRLDAHLDAMLGVAGETRIGLAVPSECRTRFEFAESFRLTMPGRTRQHFDLDVDDLVSPVRHLPSGSRLKTLRRGRVEVFADTDGADRISGRSRADHWLTAEVSDSIAHYFYWQGCWYEIGADYHTAIERRITELLARPVSVTLPPWSRGESHDEGWYNRQIAAQRGYVLLDKDTVHTKRFRGGGLEIADALGPRGELVYIKKADRTAALNHLFAQGRAAIETLRYDTEVRTKFVAKLDTLAPGHPVDRSFRSPTLVYGILLKDGVALTSESLFSFAKVALLQTATALQGMGVNLQVVSISRTNATGSEE